MPVQPPPGGIATLATKRGIAPDALRLGRQTRSFDAGRVATDPLIPPSEAPTVGCTNLETCPFTGFQANRRFSRLAAAGRLTGDGVFDLR
jgi:hypothetical protein